MIHVQLGVGHRNRSRIGNQSFVTKGIPSNAFANSEKIWKTASIAEPGKIIFVVRAVLFVHRF